MLSAAALSFGGDSGAYYHGDAAAPDGLPYTGPDFEAYTPPVEIMHAWDQADRSVDWTRAAVEEVLAKGEELAKVGNAPVYGMAAAMPAPIIILATPKLFRILSLILSPFLPLGSV